MPRLEPPLRAATPADADILARLINRASEGISHFLWSLDAGPGQDPWDIGRARARRETGGFSYRNAVLHEVERDPVAMLLGYRLPGTPETIDLSCVPEVLHPLIELEPLAPGSWYVNGLAVLPGYEGRGLARRLLALADDFARETGAPETSLIVAGENARAKNLYERVGYAPRARRPVVTYEGGPPAGDWLLMVKPVGTA